MRFAESGSSRFRETVEIVWAVFFCAGAEAGAEFFGALWEVGETLEEGAHVEAGAYR